MKEATGELNMTVITVVAIAGVAALFTVFVWPMIQNTIKSRTICSYGLGANMTTEEGDEIVCDSTLTNGAYTCTWKNTSGNGTVTCNVG